VTGLRSLRLPQMDTLSKRERSRTMAAVQAKDTRSTERRLRAKLVAVGIGGWRYQAADLTGKPDFVFPRKRVVVFVDGCFWHGCPRCYRRPSSRRGYWDAKVARNKARDRRVTRTLRRMGWRVLRIWEHELAKTPQRCVEKVANLLARRKRFTASCSAPSRKPRKAAARHR